MFTDVLLKTRFERKAKNYTLVDTIWFAEVSLRDVNLSAKGNLSSSLSVCRVCARACDVSTLTHPPSRVADLLNLFELVGSSDKFTFNCITEDEKRSWMKDMQEGTTTTIASIIARRVACSSRLASLLCAYVWCVQRSRRRGRETDRRAAGRCAR
jgi:hypothetical protein